MFLSTSVHVPPITDGGSNSGTGDRSQGAFLLKGGRLIKLSLDSFLDLHLLRLYKYCFGSGSDVPCNILIVRSYRNESCLGLQGTSNIAEVQVWHPT